MIPELQWNTWDALQPTRMVHLPTGLAVSVAMFSTRAGQYRELGDCDRVVPGRHDHGGAYVELLAEHAGSAIRVTFVKPNPFTLAGRVSVLRTGEWALRFWTLLVVGFPGGADPDDAHPGRAMALEPKPDPYIAGPAVWGSSHPQHFAVATSDRPVRADCYDELSALQDELARHGYYHPPRRVGTGEWAVLRFASETQREWIFGVACGTDRSAAASSADVAVAEAPELIDRLSKAGGELPAPARAVRDVVSWNTVWDAANAAMTTTSTRNWVSSKFGGWGVWLDDVLFNALLAACIGDFITAYANIDAALRGQQPSGILPCLLTAYDAWVDRSQPPIASYVIWRIYLRTRDRAFLERHLLTLIRAHEWWFAYRDGNDNGVLEYGSSPTGHGTFVHSKQAAMDEAAMDNLPLFDDARFDPDAHTLDLEEVGLNSLLVLDAEMLEAIATELGRAKEVAPLVARARQLAATVRSELWDPQRKVFAGRWWSGELHRRIAATSFFPLIAGLATKAQAAALVDQHLLNENEFWGTRPLPVTPFDDPASADDVYWRGRIWPPVLFLVWDGLRRYGFHDVASDLAHKSYHMFEEGWKERRCYENYHRLHSSGDASVDSDPFYSWGALLPLMMLVDAADAEPWAEGVRVSSRGDLKPWLPLAGGTVTARFSDDTWTIAVGGRSTLSVQPPCDISALVFSDTHIRLRLAPAPAMRTLSLCEVPSSQVIAVHIDGSPLSAEAASSSSWTAIEVPASNLPTEVTCHLHPGSRARGLMQ
jgi:putative isomerase